MSDKVSMANPNSDGSVDFVLDSGEIQKIECTKIQNDVAVIMQLYNLDFQSMGVSFDFKDDFIEAEFKITATRKFQQQNTDRFSDEWLLRLSLEMLIAQCRNDDSQCLNLKELLRRRLYKTPYCPKL